MRSWVGYLAVDMWLPTPVTEEGEEGQVLTYGVKDDPVRRTLAFWSMAVYVLLAFMASLVAHCLIKRYLKASLIVGFGFVVANLIGYSLSSGGPSLFFVSVAFCAKGMVALLIALLIGLPFLYVRQRAWEEEWRFR